VKLTRHSLRWAAPPALVFVWAAAAWLAPEDGPRPRAAVPVFTDWRFNPFAKGEPPAGQQHNADATLSLEAGHDKVQRVLDHGSLRGTDADGDWGTWRDGTLLPGVSLRRRFDWLLTALGEASPTEMRHWIELEVTQDKGPAAARQVLAVWDRYIALQQQPWRQKADPSDPATWQAALAERSAARQQHLGRDWAQAFYADEEQAFVAHAEERRSGRTAEPDAALLVARDGADADALQRQRERQLGPDAAERLRAEDRAWADWERRLATARVRVQALGAAPELSELQRRQAQNAYLAETFSGHELVRARALLGVEP
jgi:lipase chaperone LimK